MAYILNPRLWMKDDKLITIDAPRTAIHGDLHGGNLICELDADGKPLGQAPWIIDFALSSHLGVPFYDLAYLEIDILLRRMPCDRNRNEDWNAWLTMTEFLASSVHPSDVQADHLNEHLSNLWALLKPIRAQVERLIKQGSNRDTQAQFEWAFWLAMMAAGVIVTRRSRMEPPEKHKVALLYAARALEKLRNLLALPFQNATPFPIEWLSPPRAPEPEAVKAYLEGAGRTIIASFRSEFEGLESWAIPLEGEQTARPSQPAQPSAAVDDLDAGMREMMGLLGKTEGTHLPAGQADEELDKALQHADPVPDVPDHLMELKRAVLIGVPGAGKTVTLEQLMIRHAQACQKDRQHPIPVLVPLARFDGKQSFTDYARSYLINLREHAPELPLVWLLDALNEMPVEGVKTGEKQARNLVEEVVSFLKDELQTGAERGLDRRFVLSCRVADYKDELRSIPDVDKIALTPLAPTKIQRVIQRRLSKHPALAADLWRAMGGSDALLRAYAAFEKAGEADEFWEGKPDSISYKVCWAHVQDPLILAGLQKRQEAGERLYWQAFPDPFVEDMSARKAMLEDERGLFKLSRNPFDLALLISLALVGGVANLPSNRAELLIKQAQARLNHEYAEAKRRKDPTWTDATIPRIQKVLGLVAQAMQRTEQRTEIGLEHALTAAAEPDALDLLRKAARAALIDLRDSIRFPHQLWQEYFAALRLLEAMKAEEDPAQHFSLNWWDASAWRESLKFLVQVSGDRTQVIHWIAPYAPEAALALWEAERPGAEELAAVQQDAAGKRDPLLERIRQAAEARCEYDFERQAWRDLNPDPRGRAAAFRVLGHPAIDADQRPGVGTYVRADGVKLPDIVWADPVPPGIYPLGHASEGRNPPRDFELKHSYQVARYPITYAQFQTFLDDPEGYREAKWWDGLHEDGKEQQQKGADEQSFKVLNHPRENVSWYDAMAFCRWLSWRLGGETNLSKIDEWAVRMPTEQEWEIAARAQTGWLYPWGSEYHEGYANIDETYRNAGPYYLRQSSAVGLYPQGDARHWTQPISDLSGNVWEWCLTEYRNSPNDAVHVNLSSNARRVLCGGSWYVNRSRGDARAVYRPDFDRPGYRDAGIGFRVCRPPSR